MSHYYKKCPYCGRRVEEGYGFPRKTLGDPYRRCLYCSKTYKDRNIIKWENASIFTKAGFYLGNGRILLNAFATILLYYFLKNFTDLKEWATITITSAVSLIIFTLCVIFVRHQVKDYLDIYTSYFDYPKDTSSNDRYEKYKDGMFPISKHKD